MQQQLARPLPSKFDKVILVGNVEGMTIVSRPCVSHSFKARFNHHGNLVFKVKYKERTWDLNLQPSLNRR